MDDIEEIKRRKMEELLRKISLKTKINVSDNDFERQVIEQSRNVPVVVDFWATWCAPCRMLGPILDRMAEKYKGKFVLAKLNVDENPLTSHKYGIMSIPSVKMFKNGAVVDEFVGALPESAIDEWIRRNIDV